MYLAPMNTRRILFVCLGNICRSPLAEGVFQHLVAEAGAVDRWEVDSAGTGAWHVGELPDPRSREIARRAAGLSLDSRARQVRPDDFRDFDYVVAMDRRNLTDLQRMQREHGGEARLMLLRDFDPDPGDGQVPDPYYGGPTGFEVVFQMVLRSSERMLAALEEEEAVGG